MPQSQSTCTLSGIDHLVLTVADIGTTISFYTGILGMRAEKFEVADGSHRWALTFGRNKINLHQQGREFDPKARCPRPGSADICFLTEILLADWQGHLASKGVPVEVGPVPRTGATGPIRSLYIRDPDGNLIEISVHDG